MFGPLRVVVVFLMCCLEAAAMGGNLRHESTVLAVPDAGGNAWSFVSEMRGYVQRATQWKAGQPGAGEQPDNSMHTNYLAIFFVAAICVLVLLPGAILYKSHDDIEHQEEMDHVATERMQNAMAKDLRREFTKECTDEGERKKYVSVDFKRKASKVFENIDVDNSGSLDLGELKKPVIEYLGIETSQDQKWWTETYLKAFDENGDKTIEKEEFVHLLRCLQWKKDNHGRRTTI